MDELPEIVIPDSFNYIAAFLTFSCQLRCSYCINHHGGDLVKGRWMDGESWIRGLNRLKTRPDLPITIQGGEPSVHKSFIDIVKGVRDNIPLDVLTNLEQPINFWERIDPSRLKRNSPYASIRVSYHHKQSNFKELTEKVKHLLERGYHIGIWEVDHPDYHGEVIVRQQQAHSMGIDYRLKEFLGPHNGKVYGTMRYPDSVNSKMLRKCQCKTSELVIGPDGNIFRCHSDLYANRASIGNLLDPNFTADKLGLWRPCPIYGKCNSCDTKIKTDRHQRWGWSSVEIKDISDEYTENKGHVNVVQNTYGKIDAKNSVDTNAYL
jgi:organic radical activating enzyme